MFFGWYGDVREVVAHCPNAGFNLWGGDSLRLAESGRDVSGLADRLQRFFQCTFDLLTTEGLRLSQSEAVIEFMTKYREQTGGDFNSRNIDRERLEQCRHLFPVSWPWIAEACDIAWRHMWKAPT
jgi:hypothetical protein